MIFGVSHITLSCTDIDTGARAIQSSGFTCDFLERNAPNFLGKKPFLDEYNIQHSLALCTGGKGVAVELVQHRTTPSQTSSPVAVLFEGDVPMEVAEARSLSSVQEYRRIIEDVFGQEVSVGVWNEISAYYYRAACETNIPAKVKALIQPVVGMDTAEAFWCSRLGGTVVQRGESAGRQWSHLSLRAPVPQWSMDFILVDTSVFPHYTLDSCGFTCTVFLCRSLNTVSQKLQSDFCVESSGIFEMVVNGKTLKIEVFFSPLCGFIECIELQG